MKRIYVGKDVVAGGTKVTVKQVLGKGDADIRARVGRVVTTAQGWLGQVIPLTTGNMTPEVAAAFEFCFKKPPDGAAASTVRAVLSNVSSSIRRPHAVKVREDDDAYGYVNLSFGGRAHLTNGMAFYDSDGDRIAKIGDIHVRNSTLRKDMLMATITYIHEATHRFSNTDDHDDKGYFKGDHSGYIAPGLTWQQALNNADSYSYFVYRSLLAKFKSVTVV